MQTDKTVHTYRVRYSEVYKNFEITPAQFVYYCQDSNLAQHEDTGVGFDYLESQKKAWLISSWIMDIKRYPKLGEYLHVKTWDSKYSGIYNHRSCLILDDNQEVVAEAICSCFYLDLTTNRPEKLTEEIMSSYFHAPPLKLIDTPKKIAIPKTFSTEESFRIQKYHIDTNQHVNNGMYIELAQSYIPDNLKVTYFHAHYRISAKLNDVLYPHITRDNNNFIIQFCNEEEKPYTVVSFRCEEL